MPRESHPLVRSRVPVLPVLLLSSGLVLGGFVLTGCESREIPNQPVGTPAAPATRPSDGLLANPELQHVVDLEVARDGEGLRELLSSGDGAVRARAAFALASVQDPGSGRALAGCLRDEDPAVRRDAAFALGQLSDPVFGPVLLGALEEENDPGVRIRLVEALGKVGDERALERLLSVKLTAEEEGARSLAVARMGVRGVALPSGILYLVDALRGPDVQTRRNAAYYFGASKAPGTWSGQADGVRGVLDSLSVSDPLAMHLLQGLAMMGDPQDTPRFLWWLQNSPDWRIRVNAAAALRGRGSDPRVGSSLTEALDDPNTNVAVTAANSFASASNVGAEERQALVSWVQDHPDDWRRAGPILVLLGRMGEGDFLRAWLDRWPEDAEGPRSRGLGALAFVPGEEATSYLMEAASSPSSRIRGTALGGLARRWRVDRQDPGKVERYFEAFAEGLRTGDPASTFVAAPSLADSAFLPLGSVELLEEEYRKLTLPEDLEGMQAILGALGETGTAGAEEFLREQAESTSGAVQSAAFQALSALRGEEIEGSAHVGEAERTVDWDALATLGARPRLVLETDKGVVTLVLDAVSAPLTVQTIAGFAEDGLYDGVPFHRVEPNFVVQGGDFARGDGYGGPGFSIRSEFTEIGFQRGVVGMASAGKDTEGSQFFITHSMQPHLDGSYTAFGWVVEGMDVVDELYQGNQVISARVVPDQG